MTLELADISVNTWAARITERWRASVESIFETGRLLAQAKDDLPHGAFGQMIRERLPFGERTAQMLMAVADDKRLTNPKHASLLPASWSTLAKLTELDDDDLNAAFEQKIIRPDMIRADVDQIRALSRPQPVLESGAAVAQENHNLLVAGSNPASPTTPAPHVHSPILDTDGEWFCQGCGEVVEMAQAQSAPMPSGGLAIAHRRDESDDDPREFFPTPPWATRALIEHVLRHLNREGHCKFQNAWEPACGEGHMAEVLREYFRDVAASDAYDYEYRGDNADIFKYDFLTGAHASAENFDWIITNPPFRKSTDFVLKAIKLARTGVAMFVRLSWIEGVTRYEKLLRDNPPSLLSIFTERAPLHKARWEPDGSTFTAYAWLVWIKNMPPQPPFWIPPGCRVALSKPEDIKKFGKAIVEGEAS